MQVMKCAICGNDQENTEILFKNFQEPKLTDPPGGRVGAAYFCPTHLESAQKFAHLTDLQAIEALRKELS